MKRKKPVPYTVERKVITVNGREFEWPVKVYEPEPVPDKRDYWYPEELRELPTIEVDDEDLERLWRLVTEFDESYSILKAEEDDEDELDGEQVPTV